MDGRRFDRLARTFAQPASRRALLRAAAGLAAAVLAERSVSIRAQRDDAREPDPMPTEPPADEHCVDAGYSCTSDRTGENDCCSDVCCDGVCCDTNEHCVWQPNGSMCTPRIHLCAPGESWCFGACCRAAETCCDGVCCADGEQCVPHPIGGGLCTPSTVNLCPHGTTWCDSECCGPNEVCLG